MKTPVAFWKTPFLGASSQGARPSLPAHPMFHARHPAGFRLKRLRFRCGCSRSVRSAPGSLLLCGPKEEVTKKKGPEIKTGDSLRSQSTPPHPSPTPAAQGRVRATATASRVGIPQGRRISGFATEGAARAPRARQCRRCRSRDSAPETTPTSAQRKC